MENVYDFLLNNIYVFCIIMAAFFIMLVVIFYYVQNRKYNKNNKDVDFDTSNDINKEELEKITDEEIEKRVLEEYQKEKEETIKELEQQDEEIEEKNVITEKEEATDKKTETNIEEIISALEQAKRTEPSEVLKSFEEEQEEQAIISYKQLVESVKNNKIKIVDDEQYYKDKEQEKTSEDDKYKLLINELENEPVMQTSKDAYNGSSGGYKANEFISPVFGRMDSSNVLYRQGLEYTDKKPKKEPEHEDVKEEYHNDKVKDIYDEYLNNREVKKEEKVEQILTQPKYSDRETLYKYKNNYDDQTTLYNHKDYINTDTEILSEDINNYKPSMKHAEKMDSEEFLNQLKQFRNNL